MVFRILIYIKPSFLRLSKICLLWGVPATVASYTTFGCGELRSLDSACWVSPSLLPGPQSLELLELTLKTKHGTSGVRGRQSRGGLSCPMTVLSIIPQFFKISTAGQ